MMKSPEDGNSFAKTKIAIAALVTAVGGLITGMVTLPRPNIFFPATATVTTAPATEPPTRPRTEPSTEPPVTDPPFVPMDWTIDTTGVCRDDKGEYPGWSEYNWPLSQCQEACQNDPNCQGLAMSKNENYCQLIGSDGHNNGTSPDTQITRGDRAQPGYSCYLKSQDQSIFAWTMDSTGVCRDSGGGYPRWSEYSETFSECENACRNNPNCQGFAMSKQQNYCQLFGSDGNNDGTSPGSQITHGDSSQPGYTCFIKR